MREILDIYMQKARLISLEGRMFWSWLPCGQSPQIAHPMPAQAAVKPGARDVRIEELTNHCQKIIQRHQQRLAKRHSDRLLRRVQCRLQPVRRVAAIMNAVAMPPLIHGLFGRAEPLSQD